MIPIAKPFIGFEEKEAVSKVIDSGMLAQGVRVKELEERFADFCGTKYAVAVNSGTAALHCSMYSAGIKQGDEVITTPFTFVATANSIIMQNARTVFVDIDEESFNIDPGKVKAAITEKTKAILFVDLFGQVADVKALREIADDNDLVLVEDACQAHGAEFNGKKAGSFGEVAAFSFYATKNMMSGEGGILTTDNPEIAELAKRFRHHGQSEQTRYEYHDLGYNYRMMDLQAAIALEQLKRLDDFTSKRIRNAELLTDGLSSLDWLRTPKILPCRKHVFHQYTVRVDSKIREGLAAYLKDNGVGFGVFYPKPLHLHPFFRKQGYKSGDFLIAENAAGEVFSLPVHPGVGEKEISKIIQVFKTFGNIK